MAHNTDAISQRLFSEIVNLFGRWQMYTRLFGESDERLALLNRTAPSFFSVVYKLLIADVCLRFGRLTDPPENRYQENLSIGQILNFPSVARDPALCKELAGKIEAVKACSGPIVTKQDIEKVLQALADVWNTMERKLTGSGTHFNKVTFQGGNVKALVRSLEEAMKWREYERTASASFHGRSQALSR
jgi:hypothetical protein